MLMLVLQLAHFPRSNSQLINGMFCKGVMGDLQLPQRWIESVVVALQSEVQALATL